MSSKDKIINRDGLTAQEYSFKYLTPLETASLVNDNYKEIKNDKLIISKKVSNDFQKVILKSYHDLNILNQKDSKIFINENVRKLNYLFWLQDQLRGLGFSYKEESSYCYESHRVITDNYISADIKNIDIFELKDFKVNNFYLYLSIVLMAKGYALKNYIYLTNIDDSVYQFIRKNLNLDNINFVKLKISDNFFIFRIQTLDDCKKLKIKLSNFLNIIPCFNEKFYLETPEAKITKMLVFDSAHYITDHEGQCKNLHGGRYNIEVTIKDRIDPITGFIIDYSLLKKIVKNLVVNKFDHKTLNLTCPELSWRASTEFLAIVIWEILIEYLPNLENLKIFETETSCCEYKGNSLCHYLENGPSAIVNYYKNLSRANEVNNKNFSG